MRPLKPIQWEHHLWPNKFLEGYIWLGSIPVSQNFIDVHWSAYEEISDSSLTHSYCNSLVVKFHNVLYLLHRRKDIHAEVVSDWSSFRNFAANATNAPAPIPAGAVPWRSDSAKRPKGFGCMILFCRLFCTLFWNVFDWLSPQYSMIPPGWPSPHATWLLLLYRLPPTMTARASV